MSVSPVQLHVLLVEDEASHADLARRAFERAPDLRLTIASSLAEARAALAVTPPDLLIADLHLPDGRGLELLPVDPVRATYPVLITTSQGDERVAVEAMKGGALDYLVKTAETLAELPRFAKRALREWTLVQERRHAQTALLERERQLHHAQRLEAVGQLASGVAHDFNNLLMGVIGCADLALARLGPEHEARRYVEELRKAADTGTAITRSLLAFGRRNTSEHIVVDVEAAVTDTRQLLCTLTGASIEVQVSLGAKGACAKCGRGEIDQVILNLGINARDAMPRGGSLSISTRTEAQPPPGVDGLPGGEYVVISVADTGTGMDEATLSRIFEPFFTTKEPGKGTGLGLAMVYATVKGWGGHVGVTSRPGKGTTFEVWVPRTHEAPAVASAPLASPGTAGARPRPLTVLLVEDDARVRMVTRQWLELDGHSVLEAGDGAAAERVFRAAANRVDLLLTDVALPGCLGPELAVKLQREQPELKVLFMSGHAALPLATESGLPDGAALLAKPFTRDRLQEGLAAARPGGARRTVLLVEDHVAALLATSELLGDGYGYRVLVAATAAEARERWAEAGEAIEAVVTDLSLPDAQGGALAAEFRRLRPELPVVYISGRAADDPVVQALLRAPCSAFLSKPLDVAALDERLRALRSPRRG